MRRDNRAYGLFSSARVMPDEVFGGVGESLIPGLYLLFVGILETALGKLGGAGYNRAHLLSIAHGLAGAGRCREIGGF